MVSISMIRKFEFAFVPRKRQRSHVGRPIKGEVVLSFLD